MTAEAPGPNLSRRVVLATFATAMLAAAVAQGFGRFTFGVVLPDVREDLLGGSNTLGGFVATANTFAYLIGALLVGSLSARLTPVTSVRIGLVLSVGGLAAATVAPGPATLTLAMIAMGLGGAAIWIPSPGITAAVVAPRLRGVAVGLTGSGVGLGIIFAGQLNGWFQGRGGDWRDVYTVHASIGVVAIVLVWAVLRDRGGRAPGGGFGGFAVLSTLEGWKAITACYFIYGFGYLLILAFLTARLQDDSGFTEARASTVFAVAGGCTIFGGVLVGRISDIFGRRRTLMTGFPIWPVAVLLILTGNLALVLVGAVMIGLLFGGLPSVIAAYLVDRTDETTYGPSYAAATFAFGIAQVSSPQVGGLIADWRGSFTLVFLISGAVMGLGGVAASMLPRGS
ncbi:MAG: MFS transporter [Actinomycetota bacterium]